MTRLTGDTYLTLMEITRALERTGLSVVRDLGRHVERGAAFPLALAEKLCEDHRPKNDDGRVGLDAHRVQRDEACALLVHHLQLAAMYFEATPDDRGMMIRAVLARCDLPEHVTQAASTFVEMLDSHYERLREKDEEETA